jgi:hypothetical protein
VLPSYRVPVRSIHGHEIHLGHLRVATTETGERWGVRLVGASPTGYSRARRDRGQLAALGAASRQWGAIEGPDHCCVWIAQLQYPGSWLEGGLSPVQAHTVQTLLFAAEAALADAALSLTLFEAVRASERDAVTWEQRRARARELRERVEGTQAEQLAKAPAEQGWKALLDKREEIELQARQLGWTECDIPEAYQRRLPFLHARGFLFALDALANVLRALDEEAWAPAELAEVRKDWLAAFPQLQHVRNTAHHMEDRARGLGQNKKEIRLQPVHNQAVDAPGGAMILDMLNNNNYGGTLGDGTYGEVEVSGSSLAEATALLQRAIDAFTWTGFRRDVPQ